MPLSPRLIILLPGLGLLLPRFLAAAESAPALANPGATLTLAATLLKVAGALGGVLGLMALLLLLLKKLGLTHAGLGGGGLIRVVESRMIAPKKYIALVEIGEELLAVGIAEQGITLLSKLDKKILASGPAAPAESGGFRGLLARAMRPNHG